MTKITPTQLAELCGVTYQAVCLWIRTGKIPAEHIDGGRQRYLLNLKPVMHEIRRQRLKCKPSFMSRINTILGDEIEHQPPTKTV